jgi:folate-binding protein YgfZ
VPDPWIAFQRRDGVAVRGPDAVAYLQGQLSQDVAALAVGDSAWSWVLQPAGKVDALVRVTRTGPDALLVDVDEGYGDAVLARLARFKLRTKAELVRVTLGVTAVRGPGAGTWADKAVAGAAIVEAQDVEAQDVEARDVEAQDIEAQDVEAQDVEAQDVEAQDGGPAGPVPFGAPALAVVALWPVDEEAVDVLQRDGTSIGGAPGGELIAVPAGEWEAVRIAAGVPAMGAELTDKTIPAETGLVAITASFTKGCYTGQELVARIDSRGGNVPRHLRRLRSALALAAGDELTNADGKVVGTVTSAAVHPDAGVVGLAYVARSVGAGDPVASARGPVTVLGSDR